MKQRSRSGFTLIELLVVITIIAILASILFPVFALVREKARSNTCLSNMRQLGFAVQEYVDDHDEAYPCSCMNMMMTPDPQYWMDTIQPYVKSTSAFRCPSDVSLLWTDPIMPRRTSYGFNSYFTPDQVPYSGIKMSGVRDPTNCILLTEVADDWQDMLFNPMYWGDPPKVVDAGMQMMEWDMTKGAPMSIATARHTGGTNYVFADGHARIMRFPATFKQTSGSAPTVDMYDPKKS